MSADSPAALSAQIASLKSQASVFMGRKDPPSLARLSAIRAQIAQLETQLEALIARMMAEMMKKPPPPRPPEPKKEEAKPKVPSKPEQRANKMDQGQPKSAKGISAKSVQVLTGKPRVMHYVARDVSRDKAVASPHFLKSVIVDAPKQVKTAVVLFAGKQTQLATVQAPAALAMPGAARKASFGKATSLSALNFANSDVTPAGRAAVGYGGKAAGGMMGMGMSFSPGGGRGSSAAAGASAASGGGK